jgi:hypothetical protein
MTRNLIAATRNANPVTLLYVLLALVLGAAWVAGAVALDVPQTVVAYLGEIAARLVALPGRLLDLFA